MTLVGIIGGSGVYDIPGLTDVVWRTVDTPWGRPSGELMFGKLNGQPLVFLPRHDRGHRHSPSDINYRANLDALKRVGCTDVISVSAVGSLKQELPPGTFVIVDQFIDRTFARPKSFFSSGCVAHVALGHPVCARLGDNLLAAGQDLGLKIVRGGTYLVMEGPQFSTVAESNLYRSWGCSVIGMTAMPEAKLAREAELPYAIVSMVTDFDCWHDAHENVTVDAVIKVMHHNAANARKLIMAVAPKLGPQRQPSTCPDRPETVLDFALITAPDKRDGALAAKLDAVAGRVLKKA